MEATDPTATDGTAKVSDAKVSARALVALVSIALVVYAFDQVTKYFVVENLPLQEPVQVLGTVLQFYFVQNSGAAFSFASGYTWIFSIAASAVTVFIILFARRIRSLGWAILFGMLLGGTVGNLTDRLFREPSFGLGHVVDFIQVALFPAVFNIADSFIVASMGLFIILTVRGIGLDGVRAPRHPDPAVGGERRPDDDAGERRPDDDAAADRRADDAAAD